VCKSSSSTYLAGVEEVVKDGLSHFHKDDFVANTGWETRLLGIGAGFDHKEGFSLDLSLRWGFNGQLDVLSVDLVNEEEVGASLEVIQSRP
jgi:hypothetical protein